MTDGSRRFMLLRTAGGGALLDLFPAASGISIHSRPPKIQVIVASERRTYVVYSIKTILKWNEKVSCLINVIYKPPSRSPTAQELKILE